MEDEAEVETESEKIYGSIQSVIEDSGQDVYTGIINNTVRAMLSSNVAITHLWALRLRRFALCR
jgi:hypothetical protein